jgi:hypothetical protein
MNDFYWNLFCVGRATPYPAHQIEQVVPSIPGFAPAPRRPANANLE